MSEGLKKIISIDKFIDELKIKIPPKSEFLKLSQTFLIDPRQPEEAKTNFERGMLLYGLIAKNRPKTVLEIGTAEGFSALCMAWSMIENDIQGKIFTIDPKKHEEKFDRVIFTNDKRIIKEKLSTKDIWQKYAKKEWIDRIEVFSGFSHDVFMENVFPEVEFVYIDGSHVYEAVKSDFFSTLKIVSDKFQILFDDYIPNVSEGIKKVIDEEVEGKFDTTLIKTNQYLPTNQEPFDAFMCYINSNSLVKPLWESYSKIEIESFLKKYRVLHKRIKIRKKINKKIPYLDNIRFKWWRKPKF